MKSFEDIIAWQKSRKLAFEIYGKFKDIHDYGFRDQIQRAAVSIMNNIAEGFDRETNAEFRRYLFIAKGSSSEVLSMLYLAKDLNYITDNEFGNLSAQSAEISKIIGGLIRSLKKV